MMGDLPRKMMKGGLIIMGNPPKWKIEKMWSGRVIMGDLPRWKMVVSFWWVTYPEKMMFFFKKKMVSLLRVTYLKIKCDLPGKKTWLEQSWQDKADKLGTFWLQVDLKTPLDDGVNLLVSLRFSNWQGSSHSLLVPVSKPILCHPQLNDSFFVHNLAGLHWESFCNKSQVGAMLWG
jgi:hypothetical protein